MRDLGVPNQIEPSTEQLNRIIFYGHGMGMILTSEATGSGYHRSWLTLRHQPTELPNGLLLSPIIILLVATDASIVYRQLIARLSLSVVLRTKQQKSSCGGVGHWPSRARMMKARRHERRNMFVCVLCFARRRLEDVSIRAWKHVCCVLFCTRKSVQT